MSRKIKRLTQKVEDQIRREEPVPQPTYPPELPPRMAPPPAPAPQPLGVVVRGGARFAPTAPIAEDWVPPFGATTMYGIYLPNGPACEEARIANPPGARSPRGFPMWNGMVMFNGTPFDDDGKVAVYIAQNVERDRNLAEWERAWLHVRYLGTSGLEAASLDQPSRAYMWEKGNQYLGDLWRVVLSGGNRDMNRVINDGCYVGGPTSPVPPQLVAAVEAAFAARARGEVPQYITA